MAAAPCDFLFHGAVYKYTYLLTYKNKSIFLPVRWWATLRRQSCATRIQFGAINTLEITGQHHWVPVELKLFISDLLGQRSLSLFRRLQKIRRHILLRPLLRRQVTSETQCWRTPVAYLKRNLDQTMRTDEQRWRDQRASKSWPESWPN